jgi:hypothetical protein
VIADPADTNRLTIPHASISDNISAPRAAPKPRSPHSATMCTCGIDIATQHASPATHSSACAALSESPNGRFDVCVGSAAPIAPTD